MRATTMVRLASCQGVSIWRVTAAARGVGTRVQPPLNLAGFSLALPILLTRRERRTLMGAQQRALTPSRLARAATRAEGELR